MWSEPTGGVLWGLAPRKSPRPCPPAQSLAVLRMGSHCPSPSRNPAWPLEAPSPCAPPWTWQLRGRGSSSRLCPVAQDMLTWTAWWGGWRQLALFMSFPSSAGHWPPRLDWVELYCCSGVGAGPAEERREAGQGSVILPPAQVASVGVEPRASWDLQACRETPGAPTGNAACSLGGGGAQPVHLCIQPVMGPLYTAHPPAAGPGGPGHTAPVCGAPQWVRAVDCRKEQLLSGQAGNCSWGLSEGPHGASHSRKWPAQEELHFLPAWRAVARGPLPRGGAWGGFVLSG